MRHRIFVTAFLFALLAVSATTRAGGIDCSHGSIDDVRCQWYHRYPGMLPAIWDMVCLYYIQPYPDNVIVTIYLKNGGTHRYPPKWSQVKDHQCIGRHWTFEAARINICNGLEGDADYVGTDLKFLGTKPEYSQDETACLHGRDMCGEMGFKTKPPL